MVSEKAQAFLREQFGDHRYDYEMSDYNLESLIKEVNPQTFEELDKEARKLEETIRWIKARQAEMEA